jgi:S-DNA-T family DNA segregation ATPase FtsK/SpoIIIE
VDLFEAAPFGTDQRGRVVVLTLMFVSVIIGSIPRMGKTFTLRLLLLIAALDPRAEVHAYDLKGTGDLDALAPVAHALRAGDDDEDILYALKDLRDLRSELRRRAKVIRSLPKDRCPESKVTPELASDRSLRLHPIVIGADECQVWFEHAKHGGEFEEICTDLVKRGPALGIILILATQRPDSKSLPTGISANAGVRICLRVMGQMENDMVLGTSAYKNGVRATMFALKDKGICYLSGEGETPRIVAGAYVDAPTAEVIALRGRGLRIAARTLTGYAAGQDLQAERETATVLADILAVLADSEDKLHSYVVVERLAQLRPEAYGQWVSQTSDMAPGEAKTAKATALANAIKPYGVTTVQVNRTGPNGRRENSQGIVRKAIAEALERAHGSQA